MGTDKGLLKEEEQTWAELAARKFSALHLPVVVSVSKEQVPVYEQIFPIEQLVVDNEAFENKAPLIGLLSVHRKLPAEDLFVLACDLRDMTTDLLKELLTIHGQRQNAVSIYQAGEKQQPLCGIYSAAGLEKINALFQDGRLHRFSMMHVLDKLNANPIIVTEQDLLAFHNYNSPEDL